MNWTVLYLPEAESDLRRLDGSQRLLVRKAIRKVAVNPLPVNEGGYGKPLGNRSAGKLSGLMKIKLRNAGLRVVYQLIRQENDMLIVVIGARADDAVYDEAARRVMKNAL